ncbi:calvin cycle protein CP12-3, chloroplastic-like [Cornus florida]|uniref:calvin cycle protein CP12-3, chloroplastic-like n=1 Tax=Cornus florida TaxID=4283 RepID=UPI0028A027EB|nr:calvin cycle protein CP12-3, chloroplastic-like [Cornus florida]
MASFGALSVSSNSVVFQSSSSLNLLRSARNGFCDQKLSSWIWFGPESKRSMRSGSCMTVKGMGGMAKYKGTQMREQQLTEMIEKKVMEAKEVCGGEPTSDECKVAWDEVEEVSQAKAHLRVKMEKQDPLEYYCQDNPETDECRIYDD